MRRILLVVLIAIVFYSCQEQKIGFVDTGKVINEYQKKKDLEDTYRQKDESFGRKRDSIGRAFQQEAQEFEKNVRTMSQKSAQDKYTELGQKQQMLQQQFQFEQQQLTQGFQTEIDSIISEVKEYVNEYGKTNGYSYILGTSDATSSVLYGADTNDLTQIVIDGLNANYKNN